MLEIGIVPVVRTSSADSAYKAIEAIYRGMMEVCIAYEQREFVRQREGVSA